ncbi:enoyl-CoA hydratase/isomerase family protein [Nocardia sp. NBC_00565]|uniref:enoyl-CoA hydratase/isomerase family protein n=1 Tax=Nocardia sp. NBC_00565 TaxID=2975993 RepID=UPI002E81E3DA|nr:enoyl-CoA hydratase/isomerase family protein [Nocardia sp. NBC_00565]WUC06764.1 enoyl-CoA hydratase/isomerase family protein [Nocardia sp. NBC_00565]
MSLQNYENLRTHSENGIATITLSRPGGRNAFNTNFYAELRSAIREADVDPGVAGVIVDSAAEHFAVGGDLKEMLGYLEGDPPSRDLWKFRDSLPFEAIRACRKPTIAVVDGICCGGGFATAISCDFIIASPGSRFGTPETKVGLIDGLVGPALFGQVPLPVLKYLLFSGELIDAEYARSVGLVFEVLEADSLHARAQELLASFAANGPEILAEYKRTFRSYELPVNYEDTMRNLYSDAATQDRVRGFFTRKK